MVQYRRVIEQAKGMIMSRRSVSPDEAFAELVAASQASNVKLRTLAIALVETVGGGGAEHPRHPYREERATQEARDAAARLWQRLGDEPRARRRGVPAGQPDTPIRGIFRGDGQGGADDGRPVARPGPAPA
jgi:hypothetical protein